MTPKLVTIALSHFCEKARWALDHAGIAFREEAHAPGFHMLATRRAKGRTVPILLADGQVHADSSDILRWADARAAAGRKLFPADPRARADAEALEDTFDTDLGPHVRRGVYFQVLPRPAILVPLMIHGVPAHERLLLRAVFPLLRAGMRRSMRIDARSAERSRAKVLRVFERIGERLADGRPFLLGDRFGAADLTFAALAAPALSLPGYFVPLPTLDDLPPGAADLARTLREMPAGVFAARMYAQRRRVVPS